MTSFEYILLALIMLYIGCNEDYLNMPYQVRVIILVNAIVFMLLGSFKLIYN